MANCGAKQPGSWKHHEKMVREQGATFQSREQNKNSSERGAKTGATQKFLKEQGDCTNNLESIEN